MPMHKATGIAIKPMLIGIAREKKLSRNKSKKQTTKKIFKLLMKKKHLLIPLQLPLKKMITRVLKINPNPNPNLK
jgi:hypothetical protein